MNKIKRQYKLSPQNNLFWREHRVNGRMILPLDNYLMMILKAFPTYPAAYLYLEQLSIHRPLIADREDYEVRLQLDCDEQGRCSIHLIHADSSQELLLSCVLHFSQEELIALPFSPDPSLPMQQGNFTDSDKHHLGKIYYLSDSYQLDKGRLTAALSSASNRTAKIAGLLHGPMHCQDVHIGNNSQPVLPQYIERIGFNVVDLDSAHMLCADNTGASLWDEQGRCLAHLTGFNANQEKAKSHPQDIAIIGMAGMFPKAENVMQFWQNLCEGVNAIDLRNHRGNLSFKKARWAGWLSDIFEFDPAYFHLSETEANGMDPQQRLFLTVVDECLLDANYDRDRLSKEQCGVYVGACQSSYRQHAKDKIPPQSFWGNAPSVIAGRVAYHYDLHGPAIVFDTACSSSLVALHHAAQSIRNGSCSLAIAGGAFLMLDESFIEGAENASMLSPDHACNAFSDQANGFVPGEGVACVLLKSYSQAQADGDRIYACISASALNQDGLSNGITAPNGDAQTQLIKQLYRSENIDLSKVAAIEAHGTGTHLGDPIEVYALAESFRDANLPVGAIAIGSVKSNIGHAIHAAGMAGFIKMVLAAYTHKIPPTLNCKPSNTHIDFHQIPFKPVDELMYWPENKPYAGISSFGFSGTNAHVVIKRVHNEPQLVAKQPNSQQKHYCYWKQSHTINLDNNASYFAGHQVNGQAILPAVASLAIAQQAVSSVPCYLSQIKWSKPLIKTTDAKQTVHTRISEGMIFLESDNQDIFFRARIEQISEGFPELSHFPRHHFENEISTAKLYQRFKECGICYESSLQNIVHLSCHDQFAVAEIHTAEHVESWDINPYVLDCALQTIACFTLMRSDDLSIPSHADAISFYQPITIGEFFVVSHQRGELLFDIAVWNDQKQLCLFIEGLHATIIESSMAKEVQPTPKQEYGNDTLALIYSVFAHRLETTIERLSSIESFGELGIDSLMGLDLIMDLEVHFGNLAKTLLIDYTNFQDLAVYLSGIDAFPSHNDTENGVEYNVGPRPDLQKLEGRLDLGPTENFKHEDIAIIGMAVNLPEASNLRMLADTLSSGKDCVTYDDSWVYPYAARLKDANQFDALFFNIAPNDAFIMSPQERLMLQNAWHCFESAGIAIDGKPKAVSVYIGAMNNDYQLNGLELSLEQSKPVLANSTNASIANRISSVFNLTGPSLCLDTMCSSSLTAVYLACQSLRQGQVDLALVGGVNLITHDYKYQELLHRNMLSQAGHCAAFGDKADGYVPSEGVVSILLKPLSAAKRDNNTIFAVIKGAAINHNGRTSGYTVPHASMQAKVIEDALKDASIQAHQISYVECHGTGTRLGDPVEINGLGQLFDTNTSVFIGSLKSNYGHLEAAAGLAGIAKVVLQMQRRQLFPSLHAQPLNPEIKLPVGMQVSDCLQSWKEAETGNAYAGVSSFGAGGSNAHVILTNYPSQPIVEVPQGPYLFLFSAKSKEALQRNIEVISQWLSNENRLNLYQLAYTLALGRTHLKERLAVFASNTQQLIQALENGQLSASSHPAATSEMIGLSREFLEGKNGDFNLIFSTKVPMIADLPGYQFAARSFQLSKGKTKLVQDLAFSSFNFEPEPLLHSTSKQPSLLVLTDSNTQKNCLSWEISPQSIYLWKGNNSWQNYQGEFVNTADLKVNEVECVVDCLTDLCSLEDHLSLLQHVIVTKKVKKLVQLTAFEKGIDAQMIAYYLQCQSNLRHGFKAVSVSMDLHGEQARTNLNNEIAALIDYQRIRYQNGERMVWTLRDLEHLDFQSLPIASDKLHIVTGGTSGLGAACAEWLVTQGAKYLVLCGRTNLPQEHLWSHYVANYNTDKTADIIKLITRLRSKGCTVYYYLTPLDDSDRFEHWLDVVLQNGHSIGYVLHCAGITPKDLSDNDCLDIPSLSDMLMTKLHAGKRLLFTLSRLGYDKCVLFSSVSSVYPTLASGVLEYSLGNMALNALAEQYQDGKVISVIWPAWEKSAANINQNKHYQRLGLGIFSNEQWFSVLTTVLANPNVPALVLPSKEKLVYQSPQEPLLVNHSALMPALKQIFIEVVGLTEEDLDPSLPFESYGIDSVLVVSILKRIEALLQKDLAPEILLKHNSLEKLDAALSDISLPTLVSKQAPIQSIEKKSDQIAIVGMACQFPGSPDLQAYWELLANGGRAIDRIPESRLDNPNFAHFRGGFIDDHISADHRFHFNEVQWGKLHPLVKLALILTEKALKDAGLSQTDIKGKHIGVYVGSRVPDNNANASMDAFSLIGRGQNFVAAHINHFYDLKGPSELVDTACSSSLVAIQHAVSALQEGDIDMAFVLGCDFIENTKPFAYMNEAGALSPDFQCKPFDARANGIVLGEGGGVLLLKPLTQALSDKNKIYSTIEAVAINNDGFTMGYTTPNPVMQSQVIAKALQNASLQASDLTYVEMHATGTELGDPIELQSLNDVFANQYGPQICYVGSVKANIGHCLSAAGMAGMIKTVLCSYHQYLVAQPGDLQLAKRYRFQDSPLSPLSHNQDLATGVHHFGISAFGFGGTNAHVIITDAYNTSIEKVTSEVDKGNDAMQVFFAVEAL
ncbi:TPA: beta-ketoacyl synthase N-terminal-like domain-containing protein [Legionella pneumophila]|uniref:beta-ketoacyl synthase N-terminal-like domain-containing protein n=1 Tax=Legionella pneumophila TaxID=446 RepID=UPI001374A2D2|nr:beta-ketoacyl synthase N-terminal-like domain-containing protein [Legionella pneumophila]HAT4451878.1 KR domain-containing protein [Legionella pneumophila]HAU9896950.1 KR domain-containing protein [Legionella pneumophila]HAV0965846.1 KR domain-containing protein [Legionella pneumophila]HAV0994093.1 KR domain-containing protein [Legionella pneumophila]HAV1108654.1 KR domain-containing protein [Legionella pneumophila]